MCWHLQYRKLCTLQWLHLMLLILHLLILFRLTRLWKPQNKEREKIFQLNEWNSPFFTNCFERCISLCLQEACGGNNRKPFKHFFSQFLLQRTTFSISLRSRFPSFDNNPYTKILNPDFCWQCSREIKTHKYLFMFTWNTNTHSTWMTLRIDYCLLLPFDVFWAAGMYLDLR